MVKIKKYKYRFKEIGLLFAVCSRQYFAMFCNIKSQHFCGSAIVTERFQNEKL